MIKSKFIHILILISSLLLSEESKWATTTFEYYWNSGFNQNRFREPVNFTPFEARIGYMTYGGSDYWDNILSNEISFESTFKIFSGTSINRTGRS